MHLSWNVSCYRCRVITYYLNQHYRNKVQSLYKTSFEKSKHIYLKLILFNDDHKKILGGGFQCCRLLVLYLPLCMGKGNRRGPPVVDNVSWGGDMILGRKCHTPKQPEIFLADSKGRKALLQYCCMLSFISLTCEVWEKKPPWRIQ